MLPARMPVWETSDMADQEDLRGAALYKAMMRLKPDGLAETEWADKAGVNRGFFTNLKTSNISPRTDTLRKLLKFVGRTEADLYTAAEDARPQRHLAAGSIDDDDVVEITALDLSLSMGPGTLIEDFVEEEPVKMGLQLVQSITRTPTDRLRLVKGIGDSMEPTLRTGDRIMVDINERALARINGIYWIDHLGTHGIKRLRAAGRNKVMIMSDNPSVPDFEADAEDLRIEGRVIWFAREL